MSMYRTVDTATWTDPKIKKLPPNGKLLFLYLFTNQHSHVSGIYYLPMHTIVHEIRLNQTVVRQLLDTLSDLGLAYYDKEVEVIFVVKMFFYQGRGEKNQRGAANHLPSLHNSFLIHHFLREYPVVKQFLGDRVSEFVDRVSEVGPLNQEQDQEQDQEQEQETPIPQKGASNGFDQFWDAYPRKVSKKDAIKAWGQLDPDTALQEKILNSIAKQKYCAQWLRDNGEAIPYPASFIRGERWEDEIRKAADPMVESGAFSSPESQDEYNEALNKRLSRDAEALTKRVEREK